MQKYGDLLDWRDITGGIHGENPAGEQRAVSCRGGYQPRRRLGETVGPFGPDENRALPLRAVREQAVLRRVAQQGGVPIPGPGREAPAPRGPESLITSRSGRSSGPAPPP